MPVEQLNTVALSAEFTPPSRYVSLEAIDAIVAPSNNSEAYTLEVSALSEVVTLLGNSPAAVFYAAQSFLSLAALDAAIDSCQVLDYPRFSYRCVEMCTAVSSSLTILALRNKSYAPECGCRGMHVDVGRNFRSQESILKTLDVMAMYKLNKFYFHLTEDEGWRLEIPGIPELTQVRSREEYRYI